MNPDKNFRLSKPAKVMLAMSRVKKADRHYVKNALIDAQLHEEAARRQALRSKEHKSKDKEVE